MSDLLWFHELRGTALPSGPAADGLPSGPAVDRSAEPAERA
ncbi:hypothetical protein [Streptomyces scabichelini]|nr:hypothetical protein [Streptomyces scabichelini]